jgi:hypothetical protein
MSFVNVFTLFTKFHHSIASRRDAFTPSIERSCLVDSPFDCRQLACSVLLEPFGAFFVPCSPLALVELTVGVVHQPISPNDALAFLRLPLASSPVDASEAGLLSVPFALDAAAVAPRSLPSTVIVGDNRLLVRSRTHSLAFNVAAQQFPSVVLALRLHFFGLVDCMFLRFASMWPIAVASRSGVYFRNV